MQHHLVCSAAHIEGRLITVKHDTLTFSVSREFISTPVVQRWVIFDPDVPRGKK